MGRVLKPAARRAGLGWVGFHTFRHTCASRLFERGLNVKQVQAWLGHHKASFTLDTYVHLLSHELPECPFEESAKAITEETYEISGDDAEMALI
jgi:integrase